MRVTFLRKSSRLSLSFWKDSMSDFLARRMSFVPGASDGVRKARAGIVRLPVAAFGTGLDSFGKVLYSDSGLWLLTTFICAAGPRPVTTTVTDSSDFNLRMWAAFLS